MKQRIVVAMSGGVDSSTAAALLKEEGFEVIGIMMQVWPKEECGSAREKSCCSLEGIRDARYVAQRLGIPFYVVAFHKEFKKFVIDYFIKQYLAGFTPNPCILCNKKIKFGALIEKAKRLGADFVATGHYAITYYDEDINRFVLRESADKSKDQSYVLFNLSQEQLKHIKFPLGKFTKDRVRRIAKDLNLDLIHNKKASQEICFVEDDYTKYLARKANIKIGPGLILDKTKRVLGHHKGAPFYTIGQRRGLGVAHKEPLYVTKIDVSKNEVTVGTKKDVFKRELIANDLSWILFDKPKRTFRAKAKIRYKHPKADAT
ncbi:MAG: tRNA 2-thiouridine(34) synthase MnmA, partial [Candidatus Omnitrophica bacterium]|nr:tRNA 2-thiouridine(34) synthase MnmA [Candidatus Omnitrophota bacterium]